MNLVRVVVGACRRAGVLLFLLAGACVHLAPQPGRILDNPWPAGLPETAELADVPFFPQDDFQCGPAALATVMAYSGARVTPHEIATRVYIPARKGSLQVEMLAAPRRHGLVTQLVGSRTDELLREVASGVPVVVMQRVGPLPWADWHFAVVVGFDRVRGVVMLRSGTRRLEIMSFDAFEDSWSQSGRWAMVVTSPETIPAAAVAPRYLRAIQAMARVSDALAAATAYAVFLRRWPGDLAASIGLANALHAEGHLDLAETVLVDALRANPDSGVVMNNLAQILSDQGRNAEALTHIDAALRGGGAFSRTMQSTRASILQRSREGSNSWAP